jgi:hypothetical protein
MKTLDIALIRLLQLLVLLFFTCAVILWYGCALLLPLTLWLNLTGFFSSLLNPAIAAVVSLLITGLLSFYMTRIPRLIETLLATGIDLIKLGHSSSARLGDIVRTLRHEAKPKPQKVGVALRN